MKRPIELTVALAILAAEYLAVLPGYIASFINGIKDESTDSATTFVLASFFWFITLRPLVLYLLWRGTRWLRNWIIWTLPFGVAFFLIRYLMSHASHSSTTGASPDAFDKLSGPNLLTQIALTIGFFAFLVLYSPRVGAWFKHMKEIRSAHRAANT